MLGLAVASRHASLGSSLKRLGLRQLINREEERQSTVTGLAMRLAYTISGGALSVLRQFRLQRTSKTLALTGPEDGQILVGNTVQRRLRTLAEKLGLDHAIRLSGR